MKHPKQPEFLPLTLGFSREVEANLESRRWNIYARESRAFWHQCCRVEYWETRRQKLEAFDRRYTADSAFAVRAMTCQLSDEELP